MSTQVTITPELLDKPFSMLNEQEKQALTKHYNQQQRKERIKKEKAYLSKREHLIEAMITQAEEVNELLLMFKKDAFDALADFRQEMLEYGQIKTDNKGNFELKSQDGLKKVLFSSQVNKEYDERAELAAEHMDNFLKDFVKKRDLETYDFIKGLVSRRGKDQNFDVNLINRLEQQRDKYDHPEWIAALDGFKEAYREVYTANYVRFYSRKDTASKFELINLNFASA